MFEENNDMESTKSADHILIEYPGDKENEEQKTSNAGSFWYLENRL